MSADGWQAWLGRQQILPALDPGLMSSDATAALLAGQRQREASLAELANTTLGEKGATRRQQMVLKDAAAARADALRKGRRDLAVSLLGSGAGLGSLTRPAGRRLGIDDIGLVDPNALIASANQFQQLVRQAGNVSGPTNQYMAPVWATMGQLGGGAS